MSLEPLSASCHCGAVTLRLAEPPVTVTDCNCSICRRYGVLWAYYRPEQVEIAAGPDSTDTYAWGEKKIAFHRCRRCGCVTHWASLNPQSDRMGINARLLDLALLAQARVRKLDGALTEAYLDDERL